MADRIGTLLNRSGDGGEEVLIVSRGKVRTRFRRRDELGWNFRVESTDSENIIERKPQSQTDPKSARRTSRPRGQRVAYVRVSAADQNEARQLEAVGECDRVYVEKQSASSRADRVKLEECIRYLRDGDELVVASMDRLARSLVDLKQIVGEITSKGASVEFVHERATYAAGAQDPRADLMLSLLGAFAEFERAIIRERQAEGIAIAKAKGKYKGRKRVLTDEQIDKARARIEAGEGPSAIARDLGIGRSTLYRALRRVEVSGTGTSR
ncbi:recombinase family protein [Dietzia maris]|uniref:Recombinase family protein n=1 Tax=Dietzia maris TaxID=37915 RepID=A0A365PAE9_9ACTN|nr:recombinase family protein [Dietzia maris]MCT1434326.1 recombinase family protein [Dietzia maris]MCT1521282.1 recombinase family protein [Dietzia maris]RBA36833.1 recombinase family protein [Dietzia maris]